jgi:hypothetical protein
VKRFLVWKTNCTQKWSKSHLKVDVQFVCKGTSACLIKNKNQSIATDEILLFDKQTESSIRYITEQFVMKIECPEPDSEIKEEHSLEPYLHPNHGSHLAR